MIYKLFQDVTAFREYMAALIKILFLSDVKSTFLVRLPNIKYESFRMFFVWSFMCISYVYAREKHNNLVHFTRYHIKRHPPWMNLAGIPFTREIATRTQSGTRGYWRVRSFIAGLNALIRDKSLSASKGLVFAPLIFLFYDNGAIF